ncbi:MAG: proline dehydrogenase family protein [Acidobacteriota bacterium]|nr:proline dehydrogenase family protein [Acidobacteriota bacterium]
MLRSLFIALSANRPLRRFSERSSLGRRLAGRFVAGTSLEDALRAAAEVNAQDMAVSLDSLGESVTTEAEARSAADLYHQLLDLIHARGLDDRTAYRDTNISLKLTAMGLDISPALCEHIVGELVAHAARLHSFVRIDMESSAYTEATLALTERLHAQHPGRVGTVLQAYLYRTADDTERLLRQGIRIRLCKGAYKEPPTVAFPAKADVDASYIRLMQRMAASGVFCGLATHDEAIVDTMLRCVREQGIAPSAFEFQMLFGVRRDLQRRLVHAGFGVRVYIPFGTAWYPYFMRRLAERPANVLFLARNLFR